MSNSDATPFHVDFENPWLGLDSFSEETKEFFFGRDTEIAELLLRLRGSMPLVLYGRSGRGKTSLLRAGLIPRLREDGHIPLFHRLTYEEGQAGPLEQLLVLLGASDQWADFHFSLPTDAASRLWMHIYGRDFASATLYLFLDQFEEVFTVGTRRSGVEAEVRQALAIVCQATVPEPLRPLLAAEESFFDRFASEPGRLRLILTIRDDYFHALNRWRPHLPQLGQNCFELRELSGPAALDVVYRPGALRTRKRDQDGELIGGQSELLPLVSEGTAQRIVRFVADVAPDTPIKDIEAAPPMLSMLCRELNKRRIAEKSPHIVFHERETDVEEIFDQFYQRCLINRPEAVRILIEDELVSHSGVRLQNDQRSIIDVFANGCEVPGEMGRHAGGFGDREAAAVCLRELVSERLLSPVAGDENPRYELTHDLLCRTVYKSRDMRRERHEKERVTALLALEENPAPGIALGYYTNFVYPVVSALIGGDVAIVDQERDTPNILEDQRTDYAEAPSATKLFIIIPKRIPKGRSELTVQRKLRSVLLTRRNMRPFLLSALYSRGERHLVDLPTVTMALGLWVRRQAAQGGVNPESDEAIQFEAAALDSFETVLRWWINDPENKADFIQRVDIVRMRSNPSTTEQLAKILGI